MTPVTNLVCSPFEIWTGKKPDLSMLRVIGCKAFRQIPKAARGRKFNSVCYKGILVSYSRSSPPYRVWDYERQKVYDVAAPDFDEEVDPGWWRGLAAAAAEVEEPLFFPGVSPSLAEEYAPVSGVVDSSPEEDIHADAESVLPPNAAQAIQLLHP